MFVDLTEGMLLFSLALLLLLGWITHSLIFKGGCKRSPMKKSCKQPSKSALVSVQEFHVFLRSLKYPSPLGILLVIAVLGRYIRSPFLFHRNQNFHPSPPHHASSLANPFPPAFRPPSNLIIRPTPATLLKHFQTYNRASPDLTVTHYDRKVRVSMRHNTHRFKA